MLRLGDGLERIIGLWMGNDDAFQFSLKPLAFYKLIYCIANQTIWATIWATIRGEVVFFRVVMFKYRKLN
jgi:hypothetical protein